MNPEVFYLHIRGEQRGPYTAPQIDHLLNSGLIQEETLFWREGLEQWQPVTNLVAIRRPAKRWVKPAFAAGLFLFLLLLGRVFWPIVHVGWMEANQRDYTDVAAYWRSRDIVRHQGVPAGSVVDFDAFKSARVRLEPPDEAETFLRGTLLDGHGKSRPAAWNVTLAFDGRLKEWTPVSVKEAPVSP